MFQTEYSANSLPRYSQEFDTTEKISTSINGSAGRKLPIIYHNSPKSHKDNNEPRCSQERVIEVRKTVSGEKPSINGQFLTTEFSQPYEVKENGQKFVYRTRIVPMNQLMTRNSNNGGEAVRKEPHNQFLEGQRTTSNYLRNVVSKPSADIHASESNNRLHSTAVYDQPVMNHIQSLNSYTQSIPVIRNEEKETTSNSQMRYQPISVVNTQQKSDSPYIPTHVPFSANPTNLVNDQKQTGSRISNVSSEVVPRIQYERCVNQCKNWQTKYNQLYLRFMNLMSNQQSPVVSQSHAQVTIEELKAQNSGLRSELRSSQAKNRKMFEIVSNNFDQMVNSQKESTLKETELLLQRFKLEIRRQNS